MKNLNADKYKKYRRRCRCGILIIYDTKKNYQLAKDNKERCLVKCQDDNQNFRLPPLTFIIKTIPCKNCKQPRHFTSEVTYEIVKHTDINGLCFACQNKKSKKCDETVVYERRCGGCQRRIVYKSKLGFVMSIKKGKSYCGKCRQIKYREKFQYEKQKSKSRLHQIPTQG